MAESATLASGHWLRADLPLPHALQLDVFLAQWLAREAKVPVDIQVLPWRRCLAEVQAQRFDGVWGLSFTEERRRWAVFPQRGDREDVALRLRTDAYHWYVRAGEPWHWDGFTLTGKSKPALASVAGYSVIGVLHERGQEIDHAVTNAVAALRMLSLGRVDAAALLQSEGDPFMATDAALKGRLIRLNPAIVERAYYLAFALDFARRQPDVMARLWRMLPPARDASAWQSALAGGG